MKKRYLPLTFAFALGLITHDALCMKDQKENTGVTSTPSVTRKTNNIQAYHSGRYTYVLGGMWRDTDKFFLGAHMGYGVGVGEHSNETFTFKTPDVQENL